MNFAGGAMESSCAEMGISGRAMESSGREMEFAGGAMEFVFAEMVIPGRAMGSAGSARDVSGRELEREVENWQFSMDNVRKAIR